MLDCACSPRRWRCVSMCLLLVLLTACGRIGVLLIPAEQGRGGAGGRAGSGSGKAGSGSGGELAQGGTGGSDAGMPGVVCPTSCDNDHGTADCSGGSCVASCGTGYEDCDDDATNGCETSVSDAVEHCGSCTRACANEHGPTACTEGLCKPQCAAGFADCDREASNGCEVALTTGSDCGACGVRCENAHGSASCSTGTCKASCDAGFADCDGNAANGCEITTASDPMHCGTCSNMCRLSSEVCADGACAMSACMPGKGECDGDPTLACETDLMSSSDNCGFCGNGCTAANGSGQCSSGACTVAGCNTGFADCNTMPGDGCEVALATTVTNCGSCNNACTNAHGSTSCAASSCAPICGSGYGNCDGDLKNGCEQSLNSVTSCGMCGKICPANGGTPGCSSGVCTTTCNLTGRYAVKLSVPTTWPGTSVLSSGSGTFTYWATLQLTQSGNSLTGSTWACGENIPDFKASAVIGETYGLTYPTALFDRTPALPSTATTGTLGSSSPGATFTLARSALLVGVTMADAVNGAWPSAAAIMSMDSDADGKTGVTAPYKSGGSYDAPPANSVGSARGIRAYMAARLVFSLSGTLTSCTQSSGSVGAQDIDYHTLGCRITGDSRDCSSSESGYLDGNGPNYQASSGTYSLVKVADTATCSNVRAALP